MRLAGKGLHHMSTVMTCITTGSSLDSERIPSIYIFPTLVCLWFRRYPDSMLFERYEAVSPAVRITINTLLLIILHVVNGIRCWALRGLHYPILSPRYLHGILIHGAVVFASLYAFVSIARHSAKFAIDKAKDLGMAYDKTAWTWRQEEVRSIHGDSHSISVGSNGLWGKLLLATSIFQVCSLWLVKAALISIYSEFVQRLSVASQRLLWATRVLTVLSFFVMLSLYGYWCPLVELEKKP